MYTQQKRKRNQGNDDKCTGRELGIIIKQGPQQSLINWRKELVKIY